MPSLTPCPREDCTFAGPHHGLLDAAAERDALTTVLPCDEKHEPPYDFAYCETHDRTFALGDHCDHAGLSAWSYLDERERQQRGRAVRAEMRAEEAEADRDALAAKLAEVRALHIAHDCTSHAGMATICAHRPGICLACREPLPCPTIRALDESETDHE